MNLRTISYWVVYDPAQKHIITAEQFKKTLLKRFKRRPLPTGCVIVNMRGHYHRPIDTTGAEK